MTWLDALTLETVIVHTTAGISLKGLKHAVHDDCIVLKDALLLEDTGVQTINGHTVIPREQVGFMQLVGGQEAS